MLGRENVIAIINEVIAKLNARLNKHPCIILNDAQLRASLPPYFLQCNDGNYIAFQSKLKWDKTELTLHRMRNVYETREALNKQLTRVLEDKVEDLKKRVDKISELLELGKTKNTQISNYFGVSHVTYKENRLAGQNMFSSRWNAAWTGSRTQRTFEKTISRLNEFKHNFGLPVQVGSAPPEYSATHLEVPIANPAPVVKM